MKKLKILVSILLVNLFFSCATTLKFDVLRPAEVDLGSAKSIAIEPVVVSMHTKIFEGPIITKRITSFIEKNLEADLGTAGYYRVIGVKDRRTPADIYLDTKVSHFDVTDSERTTKQKNPNYKKANSPKDTNGKRRPVEPEYNYKTTYTRTVTLLFQYDIVDGNTQNVIYTENFRIRKQDTSVNDKSGLKDPYYMIESELKKIIQDIEHKIQPYFVNRSVTLMKVKKNAAMDYATELAEDGYYQQSYEQFINIYKTTGLMEAGFNAALLLEASGNFYDARELMEEIYQTTLNPDALKELELIKNELAHQRELDYQNRQRK